jgi:acetyl esterase/lipase
MSERPFHPQLRLARLLPPISVGARTLPLLRASARALFPGRGHGARVVAVDDAVTVRLFRPPVSAGASPALLWIHGGGMVLGVAAMDDRSCHRFADDLGIVVASVEYRLAPEHPFPTPLEDCWAALRWLAARPDVDPARIAIGGASAGGCLAAALAALALDRGAVRPVLQLLSYPMLDDRTAARTDLDRRRLPVWTAASNRYGWRSYLGGRVSPLAAPARRADLSGLPPAWIGVGTHDLLHEEDVRYAGRLRDASVPCSLHVVPGAYHGFDQVEPWSPVAREFHRARTAALAGALCSPR